MKILLFGKNGQVGWELYRSLLPLGEVVALGRQQADLSEPESLRMIIRKIRPDLVVNAAAYTNVDKAESEQDLAYRINTLAPGVIAEECQKLGALMLHYSTDYVFDGTAVLPYPEDSEPAPLNVYGTTKYEGEVAVRSACYRHLIVRSSWVYASRGSNFVRTMISLMSERDVLQVVGDQEGSPTWARYIADASIYMARNVLSADITNGSSMLGTYHLTSGGKCSWYVFALVILNYLKKQGMEHECKVLPITSEQYKTEAVRPRFSVLDNSKVVALHHIEQVPWRDALELCLDEMRD